DLREDRVPAIDHGVGGRALLGEVHDGAGRGSIEHRGEEVVVAAVAGERLDLASGERLPGAHALGQRADRRERLDAELVIPLGPAEVVDYRNGVPLLGNVERRRTAAVAVAPEDTDIHRCAGREYDGRTRVCFRPSSGNTRASCQALPRVSLLAPSRGGCARA